MYTTKKTCLHRIFSVLWLLVSLLELCDSLVDGLCDVVDVAGGEAAHGDAAVLEQVDVLLLHQELAHLRIQAGEGKHTCIEKEIRSF